MVALIEEGRQELVRRLRKRKFRIADRREEADLAVELTAYWVREAMEAREQRVAAPMGGFHVRQETWVERQHNLLGVVSFRGEVRELTGVQVKKNGGSVKGAAKDLAQQIERLVEGDELR